MKRSALFACIAALGAVACQDLTEPTPVPQSAAASVAATTATGFDISGVSLRVPRVPGLVDLDLKAQARRAINPGDYVCVPGSPVFDYINAQILEFINEEPAIFDELYFDWLADLIPTYEALLFLTEETPQSFGYHGEYTRLLIKTEKDVKRFWDIPSADIQMLAMKGTMLQDVDRVARTYEFVFGVSPAFAQFIAERVRELVLASEVLDGGNHPLFSANAFAQQEIPGLVPSDRIVMGDGILEAYGALGFDDVAPQGIYAHEFAHHIQFANDYFNDPILTGLSAPERTRYTELMADAMAAYFLTHKRGLALNEKRVEQFLEVFFQIGDCAFASGGHHGTPNQRMAAAHFGFEVAAAALKQGHILTSEAFHDLFVAKYPELIAPDA